MTQPSSYHYGNWKFYWWWTAENIWTTIMSARNNQISPLDIYFSKLFPVRYRISWQCFDSYYSSKGVFPSTTVRSLLMLPCNNWSLCWSYFRASCCCVLDVHNERTLEDLSLRIQDSLYSRPFIVWSVCVDADCYKRRQTSRPVVGTEIQTSCNFKANLCDRYYLLDCVRWDFQQWNALVFS